jgi:primosomal protein N' (replication factor Y)
VQTYWPDHPAIQAAARHEPRVFYEEEENVRAALGYPPFGRLANILFWSDDQSAVSARSTAWAKALADVLPEGWTILGPSPSPISRLKGVWRWHVLLKAPLGSPLAPVLAAVEHGLPGSRTVSHALDIDPVDLL